MEFWNSKLLIFYYVYCEFAESFFSSVAFVEKFSHWCRINVDSLQTEETNALENGIGGGVTSSLFNVENKTITYTYYIRPLEQLAFFAHLYGRYKLHSLVLHSNFFFFHHVLELFYLCYSNFEISIFRLISRGLKLRHHHLKCKVRS